ncbi:arylesterase [Rhodobacteraceae bacterium RKSG542]|uniref:arylesterase n=1 Tax=Pseudovibrio flavus TaxID=2529854 RepID=UPI0012BD5D96|nr:arylesterase [Pseudovibrio flavus]
MSSYRLFRFLLVLTIMVLMQGRAAFAQDTITIAAFGDSLSAGYMLPAEESFPAQLEKALKGNGHNVQVVNAAVSGDTTSGGLSRLDWSINDDVDMVILELGANDALRGVDPQITRDNLAKMVERFKERGITVLLAGMMAPRNWGDEYAASFDSIYPDLANQYSIALYPFFLEGVATDPKLNMADGLHPTGEGVGVIVGNILPSIEKTLASMKSGS